MKLSAKKGYTLTEQERLELGRLLLKAGYSVCMRREKVGSAVQWSIEFYEEVPFEQQKSRP